MLIGLVEIAPRHNETHYLGFAPSCRHFQHETQPVFIEHSSRDSAGRVIPHKVVLVLDPFCLIQIDHRFNRFTLRKVISELAMAPSACGRICSVLNHQFRSAFDVSEAPV